MADNLWSLVREEKSHIQVFERFKWLEEELGKNRIISPMQNVWSLVGRTKQWFARGTTSVMNGK